MVASVELFVVFLCLFFQLSRLKKKNEYVQGNCLEMDKPYVTMQTRAKIIHLRIHIHSDTPSYSHIIETLDGNEP